jgi:hypothetical protein
MIEIDNEELTHATVEAEKSCDLLAVFWRPRKVYDYRLSLKAEDGGSQWLRSKSKGRKRYDEMPQLM